MSDSELDLKAIEKALGTMTIPTKNTIEQIAAKYFAARKIGTADLDRTGCTPPARAGTRSLGLDPTISL